MSEPPMRARAHGRCKSCAGGNRPPSQTQICLWCGCPLSPGRRHGSPKRFCCASHRHAFWSAARRWVMQAIEAGLLSPEAVKATQRSAHAFGGASKRTDEDYPGDGAGSEGSGEGLAYFRVPR